MSTPHLPLPIPHLTTLRAALAAFKVSTSPFRILHTTSNFTSPSPSTSTSTSTPSTPRPKSIYILDSSFNPPTTAHLSMATSTFPTSPPPSPHHIILLLATQNADKAPSTTPAPLEHRLAMMTLLAAEIVSSSPSPSPSSAPSTPSGGSTPAAVAVRVDVAVTTEAYFHAKAEAVAAEGAFAAAVAVAVAAEHQEKGKEEGKEELGKEKPGKQLPLSPPLPPPPPLEQVYLVGFDTLVRLLDPKYYAPTRTLAALGAFFASARVQVTRRVGGRWGGVRGREVQDQDRWLDRFEWGAKGGRREWRGRVELVGGGWEGMEGMEGMEEGVEGVSSSLVREKVGTGEGGWEGLVGEAVRGWIVREGLYVREEKSG